jgi:hypothetical protein
MMETIVVEASRIRDSLSSMAVDFWSSGASSEGSRGSGSLSGEGTAAASGPAVVDAPPVEEVVVTAPRPSQILPVPLDVGVAISANLAMSSVVDMALQVSTELGAEAAQHYADRQVESDNPLYAIPGAIASLWTPETAQETILVLGSAAGIGRYSGRPFWQYFPEESPTYRSTWLTRGSGWEPPYEAGQDAAASLALPGYNPGTGVRAVRPPWYQYVRGPREVAPQPAFGPRAIGGGKEYRVIPFEK